MISGSVKTYFLRILVENRVLDTFKDNQCHFYEKKIAENMPSQKLQLYGLQKSYKTNQGGLSKI